MSDATRAGVADTLVVIHGVGDAAPGAIAGAVTEMTGSARAQQTIFRAAGHSFVELVDPVSERRVLEVNWADLVRPTATPLGVVRHLLYIVTAMLDVATATPDGKRLHFATLYRWALLAISPGMLVVMLASALSMGVPDPWERVPALVVLCVLWIVITIWLQHLGADFRFMWVWVASIVGITILSIGGTIPASSPVVTIGAVLRPIAFALVILFSLVAAAEVLVRVRGVSGTVWLARLALLYVPFLVLNSFIAWGVLLGLSVIRAGATGYEAWERSVLSAHDAAVLARIEVAATIVIGGLGLLALLLPVIGYVRGRMTRDGHNAQPAMNRRGRGAQNGMILLLTIAPIALAVLALYCVWAVFFAPPAAVSTPAPDGPGIIEIYQISILRTLPLLAWLVGPFAIVLDVVGDVLFYLVRPPVPRPSSMSTSRPQSAVARLRHVLRPDTRHPAATVRRESHRRLRAALQYAAEPRAESREPDRVILLAHSQGTVIAAGVRAEAGFDGPLVTVGSPIESLYQRFLGVAPHADAAAIGPWINGYRDGDVIAGPILRVGVTNHHMGDGGHTNYWSDEDLRGLIGRAVASSRGASPGADAGHDPTIGKP